MKWLRYCWNRSAENWSTEIATISRGGVVGGQHHFVIEVPAVERGEEARERLVELVHLDAHLGT
ncbi:MAG: hypothetical protein EOP64_05045, partial [Sphingomonas sp.]